MEAPKATILIVDDVPENVILLNRVLQSEGYAVQTAENGSQALAITQRTPPDLILLDINLPDADGFDVCARLKSNEQTSQIPVMFISALDDAEGKVRAFQLGGVDYITKPFNFEEVLARVETHLSIQALRRSLEEANQKLARHVEELTRSQQRLRQEQSKLNAFISALPNLPFICDAEGRFLEILTRHEELLPCKAEEMKNRLVSEIFPEKEAEVILGAIRRAVESEQPQVIEYKVPVLAGDERWFEGRVALMEKEENDSSKVVFVATEITERVLLYQEVQRLANHDVLTGCYNRRHFMNLAQQEFQRATRYQHALAFIMFDIDHFKHFNDRYGHPAGDQLLCALVNLCQASLRAVDILGRYGGEEFTILMPETTREAAMHAAERLRSNVAGMPLDFLPEETHVTISLGVAGYDPASNTPTSLELLIKQADDALYAAKAAGRNCVRAA
jgi:diguanylate cyclase (GGDEF)-like protein/PAS domain S-box-containing protein